MRVMFKETVFLVETRVYWHHISNYSSAPYMLVFLVAVQLGRPFG
jgi:hypothetical protein